VRHNLLPLLLLCALLPGLAQGPLRADRLAQADRLLEQAERAGDPRGALQDAARLLPAKAVPGLQPALKQPTRYAIDRVRREVAALRQLAVPTEAGTTVDRARTALKAVLARPDYQNLHRSHVPKSVKNVGAWLAKGWSKFWGAIFKGIGWIGAQIAKLFSGLHWKMRPPKTPHFNTEWANQLGAGMKNLLWIVLVMVALLLVAYIASRFMIGWQRRRIEEGEALDELGPLTNRAQEPSYWERALLRAQELWEGGNQREALRLVARACLVLLDARGVLRFDDARANGEVLRELRRQGKREVLDAMRPIVFCVDRCWYGLLPVSEEEFSTVLEQSRRFRDAVVGEG
jgi:hypothetical protein